MPKLKNRLTFGDVGQALGCTAADVRALVVEEKRLPAVYVTLVGYAESYNYQLLKVDDEGLAFDLSVGSLEGAVHTGYLRVERLAFDQFIAQANIKTAPSGMPKALGKRGETSYLNIIGGLLELIQNPRPDRDSEAAIIRELVKNYSDSDGISKSQLEKTFAAAKRSLKAV